MNTQDRRTPSTRKENHPNTRRGRRRLEAMVALLAVCALFVAAATPATAQGQKPKLQFSLPEWCNTPDGMTLDPSTNNIILACPNFNLQIPDGPDEDGNLRPLYPGILVKIDPKNEISFYCSMQLHPETRRSAPMGLDFGPDGNLYVADNQYFYDKDHKSRLMRVRIENGLPVGIDVAVDGFKLSNAVVWRGNDIFVSDTFMDLPDEPGLSAVYRFSLKELNEGTVHLKPLGTDKQHMVARFKTDPNPREDVAGADGMTLDSKGNLYIGNFGDGKVYKLSFDKGGKVTSQSVFVSDPGKLSSADGLFCDLKTDEIYAVDMPKNAVRIVSPDGKVRTLWQNADTDGADGSLDGPAEVIIRGDVLYAANFDMAIPGLRNTAFEAPHTISVIQLGK